MGEHLGYEPHDPAGHYRERPQRHTLQDGDDRGGSGGVDVPRDRDGSFEPQIVPKRQRRLFGVDDLVISLAAKGLTHGEVAAHLAEVYGASVSKGPHEDHRPGPRGHDCVAEPAPRPVYPVIFIDAIHVKIRDGQVANRPVYVAIGVTVDGERDILGLWAGDGGEGCEVLAPRAHRDPQPGRRRRVIVVCDGLKGLPDAIDTVWPQAIVQTCVVHLIRNSFRYASEGLGGDRQGSQAGLHRADRGRRARRFAEFAERWEAAIRRSSSCGSPPGPSSCPFLAFDAEIRKVIYTTNAIESLNARIRRAVNARGHFPTEQAALKFSTSRSSALTPPGWPATLVEPLEGGVECLYTLFPRTYSSLNEVTE